MGHICLFLLHIIFNSIFCLTCIEHTGWIKLVKVHVKLIAIVWVTIFMALEKRMWTNGLGREKGMGCDPHKFLADHF
jgi:hypothetical protein